MAQKEEKFEIDKPEDREEIKTNQIIIEKQGNWKKNKFIKIEKENIIDEIKLDNNFDFNKNNIQYSWLDEEYITTFNKKSDQEI